MFVRFGYASLETEWINKYTTLMDVFTNYLCIIMCYPLFDKYYRKICGKVDKKLKICLEKAIGAKNLQHEKNLSDMITMTNFNDIDIDIHDHDIHKETEHRTQLNQYSPTKMDMIENDFEDEYNENIICLSMYSCRGFICCLCIFIFKICIMVFVLIIIIYTQF